MTSSEEYMIIGAGGHTRALLPILQALLIDIKGIVDENYIPGEVIHNTQVIGGLSLIEHHHKVIISTGKPELKFSLASSYYQQIIEQNIIHPTAHLCHSSKIGHSNQIMPSAHIGAQVVIGSHNLINTRALIEHETVIGSYNHISIGSIIAGRVRIGDRCYIGAGAVINDNRSIGNDVTIGSNSTVTKDLFEPGTYVGSPARKVN